MKKLLLLSVLGIFVSVSSCKKDETPAPTYNNPTVVAPTSITETMVGETGSVTFTVSVDSKLTATYAATGTNVTITNPSGDVTGTSVKIDYTAGTTAGAASISLKITDSQGNTSEQTAVMNMTAVPADPIANHAFNISSDVTWTADSIHVLRGRITVLSGATLTIEPGTIIKGDIGTDVNATCLLIARGGKINATGTATKPIIFTSINDELGLKEVAAGNFGSPNLAPDVNGQWGGLIILGKAHISVSTGSNEAQIEGIPTSDTNGLYGGTDDADNSGVLKYVSVRHGGTLIGAGNEINGITLGGVGSGTTIDHIEVVANQDDGIEFFGGMPTLTNVVIWNAGDDGLDTDQAFRGTIENFAIITASNSSFELDGPEGDYGNTLTGHTFNKGYVVLGATQDGHFIDNDANTIVNLKNIYGKSFALNSQNITEVFTNYTTTYGVTFENITLDVASADLKNYIDKYKDDATTPIPSTIAAGTTQYADLTVFDGWSWTALAGKLQ